MKNITLTLSLSLILILSGCQSQNSNYSKTTTSTNPSEVTQIKNTETPAAKIANPASTNCINKGGKIENRKSKNGEYGVCLFEDNRQCEEWSLLRGQCPEGGVKITGYENEAEIYCAITGGQIKDLDTKTPMCKRIDGTFCNAQSNLDGDCPNPNDPNPNSGNKETP